MNSTLLKLLLLYFDADLIEAIRHIQAVIGRYKGSTEPNDIAVHARLFKAKEHLISLRKKVKQLTKEP